MGSKRDYRKDPLYQALESGMANTIAQTEAAKWIAELHERVRDARRRYRLALASTPRACEAAPVTRPASDFSWKDWQDQ